MMFAVDVALPLGREEVCVCAYMGRQQILSIPGVSLILKIAKLRSHGPKRLLDRRCSFSLKFAIPVNPLNLVLSGVC